MDSTNPLERRLQISGIFVILGLLVEGLCLLGRGPIAFILFVGLGGFLFAAGILLYLYSLLGAQGEPSKQ
jgi:hypothetical protein